MSATGDRPADAGGRKGKKHQRGGMLFGLIVVSVILWLLGDLYYSNNVLEITHTDIVLARLPKGFDGFLIAHLSDLHAKNFGEGNGALFRMLKKENPDIICIAGDFIESEEQLDWAAATLYGLREIAPVYYVTGNHEWGADWQALKEGGEKLTPQLKTLMEAFDCVWLDNDYRVLNRNGSEMVICGLTDPNGPSDQVMVTPVINRVRKETGADFLLTLSHRYDRLKTYAEHKLDLVLTGHAHGGIIRLPFIGGLIGPGHDLFPRNTSGISKQGNTIMYASRGLGGTYAPRLFNRPEIAMLTLHISGI